MYQVSKDYTNYLQGQLDKISHFMLHQAKENQRYKHLERTVQVQNQKINQLCQKIQLQNLYHKETLQHQSKMRQDIEDCMDVKNKVQKIQYLLQEQIKGWEVQINNVRKSDSNREEMTGYYKFTRNQCESFVSHKEIQEFQTHFNMELKALEKFVISKLKSIETVQQSIIEKLGLTQDVYIHSINKKKHKKYGKNDNSPKQTNNTEKTTSRIRESTNQMEDLFNKNIEAKTCTQKQPTKRARRGFSQIQPKVNEFGTGWIQGKSHQNLKNSKPLSHNRKVQLQKKTRQRSPISVYLQKENQLSSHRQDANKKKDTNNWNHYCKQFNAGLSDKSLIHFNNQLVQKSLNKKRKKTHSRSISQKTNKSQRSRKSSKVQKKNMKSLKEEKKKNIVNGENIKAKINKMKKNEKYSSKVKKIGNVSRVSSSDLSMISNSRSRSKSARKSNKNQPQYLMCCNKLH